MEIIIITITATIILATQITIFYKLKKILMSAEQTVTDMIEQVILIVTEAFNTNVGDLTDAEAQAKKDDMIARINAIINPAP